MNLILSTNTKEENENIILIIIIGIIESLKSKTLDIEYSEKIIFNPYSMSKLKEKGLSKEIINLIHLGTELENVERIIPENLNNSFNDILEKAQRLLKENLKQISLPEKKWID
jgi:hypothetical protein